MPESNRTKNFENNYNPSSDLYQSRTRIAQVMPSRNLDESELRRSLSELYDSYLNLILGNSVTVPRRRRASEIETTNDSSTNWNVVTDPIKTQVSAQTVTAISPDYVVVDDLSYIKNKTLKEKIEKPTKKSLLQTVKEITKICLADE